MWWEPAFPGQGGATSLATMEEAEWREVEASLRRLAAAEEAEEERKRDEEKEKAGAGAEVNAPPKGAGPGADLQVNESEEEERKRVHLEILRHLRAHRWERKGGGGN